MCDAGVQRECGKPIPGSWALQVNEGIRCGVKLAMAIYALRMMRMRMIPPSCDRWLHVA